MVRLLLDSLRFHWRIHLAVALGVAAAAAVLTGALVVGDSVRGSLRALTLDRLGQIDQLLIADHFFRQALATELAADNKSANTVPAILFPSGTIEWESSNGRRRAGNVLVVGSGDAFWRLGSPPYFRQRTPGEGEIVLNAPLAEELGVELGDELILRLGKMTQVPADSPLGRKTERIHSIPLLRVTCIIPAQGIGRFSLQPTQTAPRNAYVSLGTLQSALEVPGQINAIFVSGGGDTLALAPQLADFGLTLKHVRRTFGPAGEEQPIFDYFSLSSDRMMLAPEVEQAALRAFADFDAQPVLTYLANLMEKVEPEAAGTSGTIPKGIPYSTISALDPTRGGPLVDTAGQVLPKLADDEIVLTSWAAADQGAKIGDQMRVTYFDPETTHGNERESSVLLRVAAIVPLTEPSKGYTRQAQAVFTARPTAANDPDLTPEVKGITDQDSIADWDAPFPFDYQRIRDQDDTYWDHYRTTPKAFVSLATGRRLWGSRFGQATSIRIPAREGLTVESLERRFLDQLAQDNNRLGLAFQPLKAQGLAASSGTTPFDVLFLLLSMFIIAAALLLVWLLFRLGIEQRASEIGTLLALGWRRSKVARLLLAEGTLVAIVGAALGVAAGVGYAWLMLAGLRSWWVGAIASPFLTLHVGPLSLVIGFVAGLVVSAITIWLSLRGLRKVAVRQLMSGQAAGDVRPGAGARASGQGIFSWLIRGGLLAAAIALAVLATSLGGEAQAGAFLSAGALVLTLVLLLLADQLRGLGRGKRGTSGGSLLTLAERNAGRNVGRSITTIALMASAAFLIVAVSSFRLAPSDEGTGGFNLLAESSEPVIVDLNSAAGRRELLANDAQQLDGTTVLALRLQPGDDASCRNLYKATQPRILGITPAFISHFKDPSATRFNFAASAATSPDEQANPWQLLAGATPADQPVPVVLDKNTAMYSLQLYGGIGEEFTFSYGGMPIKFRVVGLLSNSVLQGSLLISEADFTRLFPQLSGYRTFLIRTPADRAPAIAALLEDRLGDEGFDTVDARTRLADLLAVQNTYISTFQSLGAIGLLLGTFGLAAVQLRSVFERRKELALLRAAGFRRWRLALMVLLENLLLLLGGLAAGSLAALAAVLPHMLTSGAQVPLADLTVMLGIVLVVGAVTGLIAVRATLRAPLVAALRGE